MAWRKRAIFFLSAISLFLCPESALSVPLSYRLTGQDPIPGFTDNVISVLYCDGQHLWAGTGGGVTRSIGDPTLSENWITYTRAHGLCGNSISAIAVGPDGTVWTASVGDTLVGQDELLYGQGLSCSSMPYEEFTCIGQPGETPMQNVTYDIAINGQNIWAASWGGGCLSPGPYTGLRKSTDDGLTWPKVVLQGGVVDPGDPQGHVAFSVIAWDQWVWVGTAGGIYMSSDSGATWVVFNHNNSDISGDFVVSLAVQYLADDFIIWAGTKPTGSGQFTAMSMSPDTGQTWQVFLGGSIGEGAWNFAFQDSTVWAATSVGLLKTTNLGLNWDQYDTSKGLPSSEVYSVAVLHDTIYAGTLDGLAFSTDNGATWAFFRFSAPTSFLDEAITYAYPNPFSPSREELGVKIRFSLYSEAIVTIEIYDWALDLVKKLQVGRIQPEYGGEELLAFWNGRNENGDVVANGVYFYKIKTDKGAEAFGKIVVLD